MRGLVFSAEGDKKFNKKVEGFEKRLGSSTEFMLAIADVIAEKNKATFKAGVKLQPKTVEWKQNFGLSIDPLVESGKMKEELTTKKGIKEVTSTELVFGTSSKAEGEGRGKKINTSKGKLLQGGTKRQKRHKVLKVTPKTRIELVELFKAYVEKE